MDDREGWNDGWMAGREGDGRKEGREGQMKIKG